MCKDTSSLSQDFTSVQEKLPCTTAVGPRRGIKAGHKGCHARLNSMPSQHTWMVSQASALVYRLCVAKAQHDRDRKAPRVKRLAS